jgi:hypothetical protein
MMATLSSMTMLVPGVQRPLTDEDIKLSSAT